MKKEFHCIMLVDDDEISNFISEKIIKNLGLSPNLKIATNGRQALQFVKDDCSHAGTVMTCPDFILLDINMPVMDGFQFLEEFTKMKVPGHENIKIVILTSSSNPMDVASADKFKISGYINKPLSKEKLEAVLEVI